jgi:hypothetical protein
MAILFLSAVALLLLVLLVVFLGGVSVGINGDSTHERISDARLRAVEAERRLHDLARDTFIKMSEAADRRRQP